MNFMLLKIKVKFKNLIYNTLKSKYYFIKI